MEFITQSLTISTVLLFLLGSKANVAGQNETSTVVSPTTAPVENPTNNSSPTTASNGSTNGTTVNSSTIPLSSTTEEPPFTFSSCSDCTSMNITQASSQTKLLLCCASFSRCCAQANAINCPTTSSSTQHSCSNFGPFCSSNNNCPFGSMCCGSTIDGQDFDCCWTP